MEEELLTSSSEHYFDISKENILKFIKFRDKYKKKWDKINYYSNKFDEEGSKYYSKKFDSAIYEAAEIRNNIDATGHITIIFSALCLEALINHYAVKKKSKTYFKKYLDNLSFQNKWIIIPKLCNDAEFNISSKAFELLGKLKSIRNELVHYKPRVIKYNESTNMEIDKEEQQFYSDVEDSFKTIYYVIEELKRIDPEWEDYRWFKNSINENPIIKKLIE